MDGTQASETSNAAAAATRKRRSSILKSQRPPRTPFSELEFHVATPTDTTKSRRVSFSRRTGVAEFATNEATTTWKIFYEEQNRSLESSKESDINARQSVGHIGNRFFEQQFQDSEAVDDFVLTPNIPTAGNIDSSFHNINFTELLDGTSDERKLTAPQNNFELSELTDHHSKLFKNDITNQTVGEMSGGININFSAIQAIGSIKDGDDLDEIERDLDRSENNGLCVGSFSNKRVMSQYIELDLNKTQGPIQIVNDSDMSDVTDTRNSSRVQEVSKISVSDDYPKKKHSLKQDWVEDKENIVVNPYVTPAENENFAINEAREKVLVFDGKKLKYADIDAALDDFDEPNIKKPANKSLLNTKAGYSAAADKTIIYDGVNATADMSITKGIVQLDKIGKRQTIVFENDEADISVTACVSNIRTVSQQSTHKTPLFDKDDIADMSVTQAVGNIMIEKMSLPIHQTSYGKDGNDMSFTKVAPTSSLSILTLEKDGPEKFVHAQKRQTIVFEKDDDLADISVTQCVPNVIAASDNTHIFHTEDANMSVTQAVPHKLLSSIIFDKENAEISMTEALLSNIVINNQQQHCLENELKTETKRQTIIYQDTDISMTQIIPNKIEMVINSRKDGNMEDEIINGNMTQTLSSIDQVEAKKRKTIIFERENGDMSLTQALTEQNVNASPLNKNKRKTIVFEDDANDLSMTQAVPVEIVSHTAYNDEVKIAKENVMKSIESDDLQLKTPFASRLTQDVIVYQAATANDKVNASLSDVSVSEKSQSISECSNRTTNSKNVTVNVTSLYTSKNVSAQDDNGVSEKRSDLSSSSCHPVIIQNPSHQDIYNVSLSDKPAPSSKGDEFYASSLKLSSGQVAELDNPHATAHSKKAPKVHSKRPPEQVESRCEEAINSISYDKMATSSTKIDKSNISNDIIYDQFEESSAEYKSMHDANEQAEENNKQTEFLEGESGIIKDPEIGLSDANTNVTQPRKSILKDLLDMSNASLADGFDDKKITAKIESIEDTTEHQDASMENISSNSVFVILKDSDDEDNNHSKINRATDSRDLLKSVEVERKSIKFTDEVSEIRQRQASPKAEVEENLQDKLIELTHFNHDQRSPNKNRHYEKVVSLDIKDTINKTANVSRPKMSMAKSFSDANNTQELLEMLSSLTDKTVVTDDDNAKPVSPMKYTDHSTIEDKTIVEPATKRASMAPKSRPSIALSRENILNNISMAQAMLQKSRLDFDDEDSKCVDDESMEVSVEKSPPKKSVRMSSDVAKTLRYDDDDSESDVNTPNKLSPLKKTAFGETEYMKDCKGKVIPSFPHDVLDEIKLLMHDLVKPVPEALPFDLSPVARTAKSPSTCSTQIQANLFTSSQIDIDCESEGRRFNTTTDFTKLGQNESLKESLQKASECSKTRNPSTPIQESTIPGAVLVFDRTNPLNNVLLHPINFNEAHSYDPIKPTDPNHSSDLINSDSLCVSERSASAQICMDKDAMPNEVKVERVSTTYNFEQCTRFPNLPSGDTGSDKDGSIMTKPSKPLSLDQSIETKISEVKDSEINTDISMKANKELLENSSSLTLVDDVFSQDIVIQAKPQTIDTIRSPVKIIYKIEEHISTISGTIESDLTTSNDDEQKIECAKIQKRTYSATKRDKHKNCTIASLDVTPIPLKKVQKISNSTVKSLFGNRQTTSPEKKTRSHHLNAIKGSTPVKVDDEDMTLADGVVEPFKPLKHSPKNISAKKAKKAPRPGTNITVQQLITEIQIQGDFDENAINKEIIKSLKTTAEREKISNTTVHGVTSIELSSCTSSKNMMREESFTTVTNVSSGGPREDSQSESEMSDMCFKNVPIDSESSYNVLTKINMLPFMGSPECEWGTNKDDLWSFRLLHSRLRLDVQLERRKENTPGRVRADTGVRTIAVGVDRPLKDKKSPLVALCISFALSALRHVTRRECRSAGEVPSLLRRCAAVSRAAARWARAMEDARAHLAFAVDGDGFIRLKVANIPLRSVWEVSLQAAMTVGDAREAAWPRACNVRVSPVVCDWRPSEAEIDAVTSRVAADWGHVPKTIWKIFKYLKHKTRDQSVLLCGQSL